MVKKRQCQANSENVIKSFIARVKEIIKNQDEKERRITHRHKFKMEVRGKRWNGEYRVEDRISSSVHHQNINVLCEFLEVYKKL